MLQQQVTVAITDMPILHAAGEEERTLFHKATDVGNDAIIGESIKCAANKRPHLRKVLFSIATNDLQSAKARDLLV